MARRAMMLIGLFTIVVMMIGGPLFAAEEPIVLDDLQSSFGVTPHLEILQKNGAIDSFVPYHVSTLSILKDGMQWTRFHVDNPHATARTMILTNEFQVDDIVIVPAEFVRAPLLFGNRHIDQCFVPSLYPSLKIDIPPGITTYYMGYNLHHKLGLVSVVLTTERQYLADIDRQTIELMTVLGIYLGVFIYTMIQLVGIRTRLQITALGNSVALFFFLVPLRGIPSFFQLKLAPYLYDIWFPSLAVAIASFSLFVIDFLSVEKKNNPIHYNVLTALTLFYGALALFYFANPAIITVIFVMTGPMAGAFYIYLTIVSFRRDPVLNLLFICSFFPIILLLSIAGVVILTNSPYSLNRLEYLFFAGANSSIWVGLGIGVRLQRENRRATESEHAIGLGRSVQDLLLPANIEGSFANFSYRFCYEPHHNSMSGDWINLWERKDGEVCLVIGDVTGKGPQAAIAVATIASAIDRAKRDSIALEGVIKEINATLYSLFDGRVNTTLSAISIAPNGSATIYNSGGVGWFLLRPGLSKHFGGFGNWLGGDSNVVIPKLEWVLAPSDVLVAVTDGICEGNRAIKSLLTKLEKLGEAEAAPSIQDYSDAILAMPLRLADDRALVLIMGNGAQVTTRQLIQSENKAQ